jgi:hypothetical protein
MKTGKSGFKSASVTACAVSLDAGCGTFNSRTMIVMMIAITPSENASSLPLPMLWLRASLEAGPHLSTKSAEPGELMPVNGIYNARPTPVTFKANYFVELVLLQDPPIQCSIGA